MPGNRSVLVVGGGTMGRGIAALCAQSGWVARVYEADAKARACVRSAIESSWKRAAERGRMTSDAATQARERLDVLDVLRVEDGCEFVIEAVPETLSLKQDLFAALDGIAPPQAILASNTSSLSISAIADATRNPGRVIGLHFFNPPVAMPLVEIVRGRRTSAETESRAARFVSDLGKKAICVNDSPGFATSRLGLALGLEAMRMVEERVASASDIDAAMELGYGHRMGPLKTSDLVGLDVRLAIARALARDIDPVRFAPPRILEKLVADGKTGKKVGEGFYRWDGEIPFESSGQRNDG